MRVCLFVQMPANLSFEPPACVTKGDTPLRSLIHITAAPTLHHAHHAAALAAALDHIASPAITLANLVLSGWAFSAAVQGVLLSAARRWRDVHVSMTGTLLTPCGLLVTAKLPRFARFELAGMSDASDGAVLGAASGEKLSQAGAANGHTRAQGGQMSGVSKGRSWEMSVCELFRLAERINLRSASTITLCDCVLVFNLEKATEVRFISSDLPRTERHGIVHGMTWQHQRSSVRAAAYGPCSCVHVRLCLCVFAGHQDHHTQAVPPSTHNLQAHRPTTQHDTIRPG